MSAPTKPPTRLGPGRALLADGVTEIRFDESDHPLIYNSGWKTRLIRQGRLDGKREVCTTRGGLVLLHRLIAGAGPKDFVYFRDGDPLNLTRANLEVSRGHRAEWVDCPFTALRLDEMYWRENKAILEIAEAARELLDIPKAPSQRTVQQWLTAAGVAWANRTQQSARAKRKYDTKEAARKAHRNRVFSPESRQKLSKLASAKIARPEHRRATVNALRANVWSKARIDCVCARCGKSFTRIRCRVEKRQREWEEAGGDPYDPEARAPLYCSRSCSAKTAHAEKRLQATIKAAKVFLQPGHVEAFCAECGKRFGREAGQIEARRKQGKPLYCSRSCANRASMKARYPDGPEMVDLTCAFCGIEFKRSAGVWRGEIKRNPGSKPYCCVEHQRAAMKMGRE